MVLPQPIRSRSGRGPPLGIDGLTFEDRARFYPAIPCEVRTRCGRGVCVPRIAHDGPVAVLRVLASRSHPRVDAPPRRDHDELRQPRERRAVCLLRRHPARLWARVTRALRTSTRTQAADRQAPSRSAARPISEPSRLRRLHDAWVPVSTALFATFTPIFIGYGGNDGGLMGLLDSLPGATFAGRPLWCVHGGSEPDPRIGELVARHQGAIVRVAGFDELMFELGNQLGIPLADGRIEQTGRKRAHIYRREVEGLVRRTARRPEEVREQSLRIAVEATLRRTETWWTVDLRPRRRSISGRRGPCTRRRWHGSARFQSSSGTSRTSSTTNAGTSTGRSGRTGTRWRSTRATSATWRGCCPRRGAASWVKRLRCTSVRSRWIERIRSCTQTPPPTLSPTATSRRPRDRDRRAPHVRRFAKRGRVCGRLLGGGLRRRGCLPGGHGKERRTPLGTLKWLLREGVVNCECSLATLRVAIRDLIPPAERERYESPCVAIEDGTETELLRAQRAWALLEPVPPTVGLVAGSADPTGGLSR